PRYCRGPTVWVDGWFLPWLNVSLQSLVIRAVPVSDRGLIHNLLALPFQGTSCPVEGQMCLQGDSPGASWWHFSVRAGFFGLFWTVETDAPCTAHPLLGDSKALSCCSLTRGYFCGS